MIVNPRGTSGSGKSTLVRDIMAHYSHSEPIIDETSKRSKTVGYKLTGEGLRDLYVVGKYDNVCGGCDQIESQDKICELVRRFAPLGHVLFEGLLMSSIFARYAALSRELAPIPYVWAFLDTPFDLCVSRVNDRRAMKGKTTPLDPTNTRLKYDGTATTAKKVMATPDQDARMLDHTRAAEEVWSWLISAER